MVKLDKETRLHVGQETFNELLRTKYDSKVKEQIALKYNITPSMVNTCFYEYKKRYIEPKPTKEELDLLDKYLKEKQGLLSKRKYTEEFEIQVGKETFEELLNSQYSYDIKDNIAKKYNISKNVVSNLLSKYRNRTEEPKPTKEQIELANKYALLSERRGASTPKNMIDILLGANDKELEELLQRYSYTNLINKLDYYKVRNQEQTEIVEQIKIRLTNIHEKTKLIYLDNTIKNELEIFDKAMNEYLNSKDYYPNYIFVKNNVSKKMFMNWIKIIKENNDIERTNILNKYYDTMKEREVEFSLLTQELYKLIKTKQPTILDFYKLAHMTINRFKSYMKLGIEHNLIPKEEENTINNFFDLYIVGSYSLSNLEEAYKINYEYNEVKLTKEEIKNICMELLENDIPITKNSIILTFEEKIKNKMNTK